MTLVATSPGDGGERCGGGAGTVVAGTPRHGVGVSRSPVSIVAPGAVAPSRLDDVTAKRRSVEES